MRHEQQTVDEVVRERHTSLLAAAAAVRYRLMVRRCMEGNRRFGMAQVSESSFTLLTQLHETHLLAPSISVVDAG
jgi:hypothetical protein